MPCKCFAIYNGKYNSVIYGQKPLRSYKCTYKCYMISKSFTASLNYVSLIYSLMNSNYVSL